MIQRALVPAEQAEDAVPDAFQDGSDQREQANEQVPRRLQDIGETHGPDFRDQCRDEGATTDDDDAVWHAEAGLHLRRLARNPKPRRSDDGCGAFVAALIAEIRAMSVADVLEAAWDLLVGLFALIGAILKGIWNGILSLFGWD